MRGTKERDKRQNGVTLIALVITIIMLFMLAEVSINSIINRKKWTDNTS